MEIISGRLEASTPHCKQASSCRLTLSMDPLLHSNRSAPPAQPLMSANRTLPSTILAPCLSSTSSPSVKSSALASASGSTPDEYAARPPPQILRREKAGYGPGGASEAGGQGQAKPKTLAEREDEYRRARERIFGTPLDGATAAARPSPNASGRSSPASGARRKR